MKIVFMGSPEFAIPSLQAIVNSKHELEVVITTPDKERGRGQKVSFSPVKEFAVQKNFLVLQPDNLKDEEFLSRLKAINADVFIIVAFRILPKEVYTLPTKGTFNLHGSLLPKYRGAAPIQWAIINGETETGLTTFFLQEKVDTGNIILQEKIIIKDEDNFGTLHDKMSIEGANLIMKTLELIELNKVEVKEQNNSLATPAPKITKEICQINWKESAQKIHDLIRGLSPYPGAFFINKGKQIKIYKSSINRDVKLKPGEIYQSKNEAIIGCGENSLNLLELQPEGRKRLTIAEFLRGYSLIED
jgi:methionyl-tRNA formyltransferase